MTAPIPLTIRAGAVAATLERQLADFDPAFVDFSSSEIDVRMCDALVLVEAVKELHERSAWMASKTALHAKLDAAGVPIFDGEECRIAKRVEWLSDQLVDARNKCDDWFMYSEYLKGYLTPDVHLVVQHLH